MNFSTQRIDAPLAAGAGKPAGIVDSQDPYVALDELMVVIEALCPVWPQRPPMTQGDFRL